MNNRSSNFLTSSHNFLPGNPLTQSMNFSSLRMDQDILDMRKEMRQKEQEFQKAKALLNQKVELLELQVRDAEDKQESQKKVYEQMLGALKNEQADGAAQCADYNVMMVKKEMQEQKSDFENQVRVLKYQVNEKESEIKDLVLKLEDRDLDHMRVLQDKEMENKKLINKIKRLEMESEQSTIRQQSERGEEYDKVMQQLAETNRELQRQKDQSRQIEEELIQQQENIKMKHAQELKDCAYQKDQAVHQSVEQQILANQKEINSLKEIHYSQQRQQREEIIRLTTELEQALDKAQKSDKQLEKIKNMPKPITVHLSEESIFSNSTAKFLSLKEENIQLTKKLDDKSKDLREIQDKFEDLYQLNKKLKIELIEAQGSVETDRVGYQSSINLERRKTLSLEQELEAVKLQIDSMMRQKDTGSNIDSSPNCSMFSKNGVSNTTLRLYKMCQKMVDCSLQMECARCKTLIQTHSFYDHIQQGNCENHKSDLTLCLEDEDSIIKMQNNPATFESHANFNPLSQPTIASYYPVPTTDMGQRPSSLMIETPSDTYKVEIQKSQGKPPSSNNKKPMIPPLDLKMNEFGQIIGNKNRRTPQELILLTPSVDEEDDQTIGTAHHANDNNIQFEYTQDDEDEIEEQDDEESYYSEIQEESNSQNDITEVEIDLGEEGDKSTYLRPSRMTKSAMELNQHLENQTQRIRNPQQQKVKKKQKVMKENKMPKMAQVKTCRAQDRPIELKNGLFKEQSKMPHTSRKCTQRYQFRSPSGSPTSMDLLSPPQNYAQHIKNSSKGAEIRLGSSASEDSCDVNTQKGFFSKANLQIRPVDELFVSTNKRLDEECNIQGNKTNRGIKMAHGAFRPALINHQDSKYGTVDPDSPSNLPSSRKSSAELFKFESRMPRDSLPSPINEYQMTSKILDPFSFTHADPHLLPSAHYFTSSINVSKYPQHKQDNMIHVMPQPKFISTLKGPARLRSYTQIK